MQKYTKIRYETYGLDPYGAQPLCQRCLRNRATEIHHIFGRLGKLLTEVKNLIALCRSCHVYVHDNNTEETKKELRCTVDNDLSFALARKKRGY